MSVYRRTQDSGKFHTKPCEKGEVSQNLLFRIDRNVASPKSLPNVIILHFSILVTTKMCKVLEP